MLGTFTPFWISPASATNLLVIFIATNSGPNKGTLYFDTNDDNEDGTETYFYISLEAVASPSGTAPVVSITGPANGSTFTAPVNIPLTASATASNATISLVDFFDTTSGPVGVFFAEDSKGRE